MAKTKPTEAPGELQDLVKTETAQSAGEPTMDVTSLLDNVIADRVTRPAMAPPGETTIEADEAGVTAWHNGKKITAMWTNSSNRNAYAAVQGLGWKKLSNANDSAHLSLAMLAAHAEQTNATVNVELGTDQEIHQIYVW
jgi:hypothetical protein